MRSASAGALAQPRSPAHPSPRPARLARARRAAFDNGWHAPGRCSHRERCAEGDSLAEPLLVAHSVLVAHARAVQALRALSAAGGACEGCRVAMVNCIKYTAPMDPASEADWQAAQWRMESELGIWTGAGDRTRRASPPSAVRAAHSRAPLSPRRSLPPASSDPVFFGDYPQSVVQAAGKRLPPFSAEEKRLLAGSVDFFGLNLYTAQFAKARFDAPNAADAGVMAGSGAELDGDAGDLVSQFRNATRAGPGGLGSAGGLEPVGVPGSTSWLFAAPGAMRNTLRWVSGRYGAATEIVVTEAGCADQAETPGAPLTGALDDQYRIAFLFEYIRAAAMARALDGVNVTGFQVWSLLDNYEWQFGYTQRFGLVRVQFGDGLQRLPKASFEWYRLLIAAVREGGAPPARLARAPAGGRAAALLAATVAVGVLAAAALVGGSALRAARRARAPPPAGSLGGTPESRAVRARLLEL